MERVLEAGPIPYGSIALCGDADLEHALRHNGVEPETMSYRLIELVLPRITDTRSMPHRVWNRSLAEAVLAGVDLPPLVVFRHQHGQGWGCSTGTAAQTRSSNSGFRLREPTS